MSIRDVGSHIIDDEDFPILGGVSFFDSGKENRHDLILDKANENSFVALTQI